MQRFGNARRRLKTSSARALAERSVEIVMLGIAGVIPDECAAEQSFYASLVVAAKMKHDDAARSYDLFQKIQFYARDGKIATSQLAKTVELLQQLGGSRPSHPD